MNLFIGVALAVIATFLINYSNYMQKRELSNMPEIGSQGLVATLQTFINCIPWLKAQGMQLFGTLLDNIAVAFAPLSVIQPINASGICLLVILAVTRLDEKPTTVDWIGTGSIIAGVILLGITLVTTKGKELAYRPVVLWFFIILMSGSAIASLAAAFIRKDERMSSLLGISNGLLVGLTAILMKLFWKDLAVKWPDYKIAAVVFSPYFWAAVGISLFCAVLFQIALQRGSAIIVVPLVTGFSNLVPIFVGWLAFREPFPTGGLMITFRLASIFLIIGGAILLSLRKEPGAEALASA